MWTIFFFLLKFIKKTLNHLPDLSIAQSHLQEFIWDIYPHQYENAHIQGCSQQYYL